MSMRVWSMVVLMSDLYDGGRGGGRSDGGLLEMIVGLRVFFRISTCCI